MDENQQSLQDNNAPTSEASLPPSSHFPQDEKPYAAVIIRWAAVLVDLFIVSLLTVPALLIVLILKLNDQDWLTNLIVYGGHFIYSTVLVKIYGATWGKMFFKIKVKTVDGKPMSWWRAFLREVIGQTISSLVLCVGYIWAIFDKRKQSWHDKIARTIVIQDEPISKARRIFAYVIAIPVPLALVGILAAVVLLALDPARQLDRAKEAQLINDIHDSSDKYEIDTRRKQDDDRKFIVTQLATAQMIYFEENNSFPPVTNTWITDIFERGGGSFPPMEIEDVYTLNACDANAGSENGFCYQFQGTNAILYSRQSSNYERDKCPGKVSWFVYSTADGRDGIVCTELTGYPQPGVQVFAK
jgi:uncharacterized RDD family membrane protein YckC